jgi:uncharacterized protein (TIGR02145 family)
MNRLIKITLTLVLLCTTAFAQQKGTLTDSRDGKKYKTAKIGSQTWMAQNLDYAGKNDDIGVCCNKDPKFCEKQGALYSWDEAMKVCPAGWHLPSIEEWKALEKFAGGPGNHKKLRSQLGWSDEKCVWTEETTNNRGKVTVIEHDECNTDEFGFSALPGGYYRGDAESFDCLLDGGFESYWWTTTKNNCPARLSNSRKQEDIISCFPYSVFYLYPVRCIQDSAANNNGG